MSTCKCSRFRTNKCKCKVLRSGYRPDETGSVVLLTQSNSLCRLLDLKEAKPHFVMNIIENVYETCAGYNLRYCPIRGFMRRDKHLSYAVTDLIILICFFVANFVVFVTILSKMMVHLYLLAITTAQWIRRSLDSEVNTDDEVLTLSPTQLYHNFRPPVTHKFL